MKHKNTLTLILIAIDLDLRKLPISFRQDSAVAKAMFFNKEVGGSNPVSIDLSPLWRIIFSPLHYLAMKPIFIMNKK